MRRNIMNAALILLFIISSCSKYIIPTQISDVERKKREVKILELYQVTSIHDFVPLLEDILYLMGMPRVRENIFEIMRPKDYRAMFDEDDQKENLKKYGMKFFGGHYTDYFFADEIVFPRTNSPYRDLETVLHELGHKYGSRFKDPVLKEFEAYAFTAYAFHFIKEKYPELYWNRHVYFSDILPGHGCKVHFPAGLLYYEAYKRLGDHKLVWEFATSAGEQEVTELLRQPVDADTVVPFIFTDPARWVADFPMEFKFSIRLDQSKLLEMVGNQLEFFDLEFRQRYGICDLNDPKLQDDRYLRRLVWMTWAFGNYGRGNKELAFFYLDVITKYLPDKPYDFGKLLAEYDKIIKSPKLVKRGLIIAVGGNAKKWEIYQAQFRIAMAYVQQGEFGHAHSWLQKADATYSHPDGEMWLEYVARKLKK